ncbi:MAG TPA: 30S ribosomal protein S7 [Candidatus Paceibacterota bacterium]
MRRAKNIKREVRPDPVYGSLLISKFTNRLMVGGKKSTAYRVLLDAMEEIKKVKKGEDPLKVLELAINNISPNVEIRPRRVGGATYQVPREVSPKRRLSLALRWIVSISSAKKGKPMAQKLAEELLLATKNEGAAIKKKLDTHRMAEANKAFAHFAW